MRTLHISVLDKKATYLSRDGDIVCGNSDYLIEFAFDAEWNAHTEKTARFIWNGTYQDVPFSGTACYIPVITHATELKVGVYAGELRTTTTATITCQKSVLCESASQGGTIIINGGGSGEGSVLPVPTAADNGKVLVAKDGAWVLAKLNSARIGEVTLLGNGWIGGESLYSQVVSVEGVTANSQVDLTPSVEQLAVFHQKDLAFVTENENGVITVYAIGQKPEHDYTIQVTITEVSV